MCVFTVCCQSGETAQKAAAVEKSLGGGAESTEQEARQAEEEEVNARITCT